MVTAICISRRGRFHCNGSPDLGDVQWQRALLSSLIIGAIACIVSTTTGFFAAYAFLRAKLRAKKFLLSLMLTPIIVPSIITAIAMYDLAASSD